MDKATIGIKAMTTTEKNQLDATIAVKQLGLGLQLKTAREQANLSISDAAARLYLNSNIITLLENEDFENAPPLTFIRGYARSYARLLNLNDDAIKHIIKQLEAAFPQSQTVTPTTLSSMPTINSGHRYIRGTTFLVVSLIVALVGIWWKTQQPKSISHQLMMPFALNNTAENNPVTTDQQPKAPTTAPAINTAAATATTATPTENKQAPTTVNPAMDNPIAAITPQASVVTPNAPTPPITSVLAQNTPPTNITKLKMALPEPGLEEPSEQEE
jgi:cytoskeleton protein RodZ